MGVDDEERRLRSGRCVAVFRDCLGFVAGSTYHHSLYGDDIEADASTVESMNDEMCRIKSTTREDLIYLSWMESRDKAEIDDRESGSGSGRVATSTSGRTSSIVVIALGQIKQAVGGRAVQCLREASAERDRG